ncbi:hypothetical protein D3C84_270560 [compost metagenome]
MGHEVRQANDAGTGQRQLAQGFTAGRRQPRLYVQAVALGMAQGPMVEAFGLGEAQQHMAAQVLDPLGRAMPGQVVGAGQDVQRAAAQKARVQGRIGQGPDANGNVGALFEQVDDQVVGVEFQQDIRVQPAKLAHPRHDGVQHERRCRIDAQAPGRRLLALRQAFFQLVHLVEDLLGPLEEKPPLLGQVHAPGGAVDQGGIELALQSRQGAADGRWRLADLLGGGRNRAALDDRDEHLQFIGSGFHCAPFWSRQLLIVAARKAIETDSAHAATLKTVARCCS